MATKTTKPAARKTATARKPVKAAASSSRSSAHAEPKKKETHKETKPTKAQAPAKVVSKPAVTHAPAKLKSEPHPPAKATAPPAKPKTETPAKPVEPPKPKAVGPRNVESVSLIDEKKPKPKRVEADGAVKRAAVLPPISRLRTPGPLPAPVAPPAPKPEAPPAPAETTAEAPTAEPEADQKIIHIKPPI